MCALIVAVESERIHQIKLLLSNLSLDINQTDSSGQTALFKACLMKKKWKSVMVAKLLIAAGIDINVVDNLKRTCLSYACMSGKEYLVKILLETGDMAPNTQDVNSFTNLMYAVKSTNHSVVAMLLLFLNKYGLSLDTRTKDGFTAYMLALKLGLFSIADLLQDKGASTETFDFEMHRKSGEWRRISAEKMKSCHRRASTAPVILLQDDRRSLDLLEQTQCRIHRQTSLFVLKENTKKDPVEFYHTSDIQSAGFSELANLFNRQREINKSERSGEKLPTLISNSKNTKTPNKSLRMTRQHTIPSNWTENSQQVITDAGLLQYSTKRIIGTLLNESVLTKNQSYDDKSRLQKIANFHRANQYQRVIRGGEFSTPSLHALLPTVKDVVENVHGNDDDRMDIRRCRSSDPSRMRIRSTDSMRNFGLRRTSTTH